MDELAAETVGTRHPSEGFPVPADRKKDGFRQKLRLAALADGGRPGLSMCVVPWDVAVRTRTPSSRLQTPDRKTLRPLEQVVPKTLKVEMMKD